MALTKHLERVQRMHRMIKFKRTGTPTAFALRMGISESFLYRLLGDLRSMGAPIHYCQARESYVYSKSVELKLGFYVPGLTESELLATSGGATIKHLDLSWRWTELSNRA